MYATKDELDQYKEKICKIFTDCLVKKVRSGSAWANKIRIRPDPDPQHSFYAYYTDLTIVWSPGAALALLSIDVELVDVLQSVVGQADVGPRVEGRHGSVPHAVRSTLPFKSGHEKS